MSLSAFPEIDFKCHFYFKMLWKTFGSPGYSFMKSPLSVMKWLKKTFLRKGPRGKIITLLHYSPSGYSKESTNIFWTRLLMTYFLDKTIVILVSIHFLLLLILTQTTGAGQVIIALFSLAWKSCHLKIFFH